MFLDLSPVPEAIPTSQADVPQDMTWGKIIVATEICAFIKVRQGINSAQLLSFVGFFFGDRGQHKADFRMLIKTIFICTAMVARTLGGPVQRLRDSICKYSGKWEV